MPSVEEVCKTFDLIDVPFEYSDADYQNFITYKMFQQHVRPVLQKENPRVPMSKLMMLVAAKWREFSDLNPHLQQDTDEADIKEEEDVAEPKSPEIASKETKFRSSKKTVRIAEEYDDEYDDDEESKTKSKKRGRNSGGGSGTRSTKIRKQKVPTLRIKFGKRRNASSDEDQDDSADGSERESDIEFEKMLQQTDEHGDDEQQVASTSLAAFNDEASTSEPTKRKKAKTKIGNKSKKKKSKKTNFQDDDIEHQDYCEACQQGGEIILCDTCPKAYHLVCLDPELEEAPEGNHSSDLFNFWLFLID